MAKITVYLYELPDPFTGVPIRSRRPATRRAIDAAGGRVIAESALDVELQWVSDDGVVTRWPLPSTGTPSTPQPAV